MTRKAKHIQALSEAEYVELIRELRLARYADIPAIDLYMDQLLTYIDAQLRPLVAPDEKLLTASMVNNYVKVGMIPRPAGKKYDREHLAMLLMICVFKQALSMESISRLLGFLCERDVRTGYDQFCAIIRRIEESAKGGRIELFGDGMDEREMALRSGVMAALCTIHTCRLLEKERA